MKRLAFLAIALSTIINVVNASQTASPVKRTDKIPIGFQTYSLFLVCNPEWLSSDKSKDLYSLYEQFQSFGRTIGIRNDAVWFWISDAAANSELSKNVDVERSVRFCKAWKLKPSSGPHLVVTCTYPDESNLSSGLPKDSGVYELGNMSSHEIGDLLASLTDRLSETHNDYDLLSNELWVRLLDATQRLMNKFACAWSFKVDAGPINASLRACQGP